MISVKSHDKMPIALVTGFDAFGGDAINPSWLAAQALHGDIVHLHRVVAAQLPTEFAASRKVLAALLRQHTPSVVLCLGLASGRSALSIERIAINVQDARIADNAGAQPVDVPIVKSGPAAYFSTLPIKAMLQALTTDGIPAEVSQTAGTFVCNHVFYALLHALKQQRHGFKARGGFMHVPCLPDQGTPNMPLTQTVQGLRIALACALSTQKDHPVGAGTLS